MTYATTNPYTNEVVKTFPDLSDSRTDALLDQAQAAYEAWRRTSFADRKAVMAKAAKLLVDQEKDYAHLVTLEMGKLYSEALAEVELSSQILAYYADHAEELLAPKKLPVADPAEGDPILVSEPVGIIMCVEPWNFPYYQLARVAGPNIMAGNVVMVKHASIVPQCAAAFEKLFHDAGAPAGVYTNLYANRGQVARVIADPRVRGVAVTGSEAAGATVAAQAGQALKKSTMELGGSDAFIVLPDADITKTAKWAVFGRNWNGGQVCIASKRLIVVDSVADEFLAKYKEGVAALHAGDPFDASTTIAPLSSQSAADELKGKIAEAVEHGAKATELGAPVPTKGAWVQPTILENVTPDNPAYHKEFFGPVAMFFRVPDEDAAVKLANDSPFGLGGSVFTSDTAHGVEVAKRIDTGMVFVNHPTSIKADLPFGGVKRSGYGRETGALGIQEFVNKKLINVTPIDSAF